MKKIDPGVFIGFGIPLGAGIGVALGNVGVGIGLGVAFGLMLAGLAARKGFHENNS